METPISDRIELERSWNERRFAHNVSWQLCRASHRMFIHEGKRLVAWTVRNGQPEILAGIKIEGIRISFSGGIVITADSTAHTHQLQVCSTPREHIPGIFWWLPAFTEFRHTPMHFDDLGSTKRVTLALMSRALSPMGDQSDGSRHLGTLKEFQERWPNIL